MYIYLYIYIYLNVYYLRINLLDYVYRSIDEL